MARKQSLATAKAAAFCFVFLLLNGILSGNQAIASTLQAPGSKPAINNPWNHAVFSCLIKHPAPTVAGAPKKLRLYLDSGGDIYPEASFLPNSPDDIRQDKGEYNSQCDLQWYFDREDNQAIRDRMFARYGVDKPAPTQDDFSYDTVAWDKLRTTMAGVLAKAINSATDNGKKTLVVLVHGYNVGEYEHAVTGPCKSAKTALSISYYDEIEGKLMKLRPELKNAVWLEVYWDGFQDYNIKLWGNAKIWGAAQASARYVGLGLREVLRQTDSKTPVRVFTHSAGGLVISQALWNNDAFTNTRHNSYEKQLTGMMKHIPAPAHSDIRVGMLVPALTSVAFKKEYYQDRSSESKPAYRIVVGQNERDYAIMKSGIGCQRFSDTCMGADEEAFNYAKKEFGGGKNDLQRVDFCVTNPDGPVPALYVEPRSHKFEKHAWVPYFSRQPLNNPKGQPIMVNFLHRVLD